MSALTLTEALQHTTTLKALLDEHPGEEPICPFPAAFTRPLTVLAVLERTAVVQLYRNDPERGVVALERLVVDPAQIQWRPDIGSRKSENGQAGAQRVFTSRTTLPPNERRRQELREASDQRALRSRAEVVRPIVVVKSVRIGRKRAAALAEQGMRHCAQCGQDKATSEFWRNGYCRECGRAKDRAMHKNRLSFKPCPTCHQVRRSDEFPAGSGRHSCNHCKAQPAAAKWKPSPLAKLRTRRARVAATLAELDRQIAEMAGA